MKYLTQIRHYASISSLDASLIMAMVHKESSCSVWAYNPEPRYSYLWDIAENRPFRSLSHDEKRSESPPDDWSSPPGAPADAEWWGQQASWGLMQIMGAVARERGFKGTFLTELCNIQTNLSLGTKFLATLIDRYGVQDGVAAYNAGPGGRRGSVGQAYASDVMQLREDVNAAINEDSKVAV